MSLSNRSATRCRNCPDRRKRFGDQYGLSFSEASQLVADRSLADYYEDTVKSCGNARAAANWIRSELLRELEVAGLSAAESRFTEKLAALSN